ncbi:MAG: Crp/Fnr family transcriptional regulator [Hyphomicrobiales bacterium]|nr:Crp/Fnr family transcriptional regulator [Hyphomicrobiales bacterium]
MSDLEKRTGSLGDINLFHGLPENSLKEVAANARPVQMKAGKVLFIQGDQADGCYAIISGAMRVSFLSADGNETVLTMMGPGDVVGEMGLFGSPVRSATVSAQSDAELMFIAADDFMRAADASPQIYRYLLKLLATRLRATNEAFATTATMPLSSRLARVLILLSQNFGEVIPGERVLIRHRFTQSDLCLMAGSARENISRQLNSWKRKELIDRISYYYCLNDLGEMRRIAGY